MSDDILCVGEILWDALPDGLFLGGAPFNVASHLRALGRDVAFASRVGDDRLGQEALRRMQARDLAPDLVQIDDTLPTGFVQVELGAAGEPDYEILEPVAWDAIADTSSLRQRAEQADALVFGSLAQRTLTARQTIQRLYETDGLCVFDVNLRPPFVDRTVVEQSLRAADVAKLNDAELRQMRDWFDLPDGLAHAMHGLATSFDLTALCVTRGAEGAGLWRAGETWHHPGYAVDVADTVGAGDAFVAALLAGTLEGRRGDVLLELANRLGAFVASRSGAVPAYEVETLNDIRRLDLPGHERSDPAA